MAESREVVFGGGEYDFSIVEQVWVGLSEYATGGDDGDSPLMDALVGEVLLALALASSCVPSAPGTRRDSGMGMMMVGLWVMEGAGAET